MSLSPGTRLGPYEVLAPLGAGGMGEVYRARDARLERDVALKVLPDSTLGDEVARARLLREARMASKLNHPHICTIHEVGDVDGQVFIAMELVEGRTLSDRLAAQALPYDEVLRYGQQLADALAHAHEHGVVHRDFKSANVALTPEGRVKVLDFGLAENASKRELAEATTASGAALTETGTMAGTPAYMAPEQLQGQPADARSDVWALGVVLYEMATGRRPFRGSTGLELASAILSQPPVPLPSGVPASLAAVIERCLAKEPAARYQRGSEVRAALESIQSGRTPSPWSALKVTARRRPWAALGVGLVAIGAAVLLAVLALSFARRRQVAGMDASAAQARPPVRIVVLPFDNLGGPEDGYFAAGITEEITSRLASVRSLAVISRTTATQYDRRGKTVEQIGKDLGVGYVLEGSVRWDKSGSGPGRVRITPQLIRVADDTHLWSDRYDRLLADIFAIQGDVADGVVRALNVTLAPAESTAVRRVPTRDLEAYDLYLRALELENRNLQPLDIAEQIRLTERAVARDPEFAEAIALLARARTSNYWLFYDRSESELERGRVEAERAVALRPDSAEAHVALGFYYYQARLDYERALAEFGKALELQPNEPSVHAAIGYVTRRQGRPEEAEAHLQTAVGGDPRNGTLFYGLGETQLLLRHYPDAIENLGVSTSINPDQAAGYTLWAWAYVLWHGDVAAAERVLQSAAGIPDLDDPAGSSDYFVFRLSLIARDWKQALHRIGRRQRELHTQFLPTSLLRAEVQSYMGRGDLARASYEDGRRILVARIAEAPEDARLHSSLGIALAGLGRTTEAVREGGRGVELMGPSRDAFRGPFRMEDLALIYAMVGNQDAAIQQLDRLLSGPSWISVPLLRLDPRWDPLRRNPKFDALLAKYTIKE